MSRSRNKEHAELYRKAWRKQHAEQGLCADCCNPVEPGHRLCAECAAKKHAYYERTKEHILAYQRERYARLNEQGLCVHCGKNIAELGMKICKECSERGKRYFKYDADAQHRYREKLKASGICTNCKKRDARPGRTTCAVCAKNMARAAKKWREWRASQKETQRELRREAKAC